MKELGSIKTAALIAQAGMDPMSYLLENDPAIRDAMMAVANEFDETQRKLDENRAILIAQKVGKMLGG
jgi:hypothetical protein